MECGNIASGYLTDLSTLIERFQLKRSLRYAGNVFEEFWLIDFFYHFVLLDFCEAWQELEFYKVFDGRKLETDHAEYTDTVYQITIKFLVMKDVSFGRNMPKKCLYAIQNFQLHLQIFEVKFCNSNVAI